MDNFDIIIYAAIAAFLAFRLWSVLGQRGEDDPSRPERPNPFGRVEDKEQDEENVIVIEGRSQPAMVQALTSGGHAPASLAGTMEQIKAQEHSFDEKKFMEGAKIAFQQIVDSFAKGDLTPIDWLLGPNVREPFARAIKERKEKGQTLVNKIDRMVAADIVAAKLEDKHAYITVEFVSHQSHKLIEAGETAAGKPWPRAEEIRDLWTFHKELGNTDPNWRLVETKS